MNRTIFTITVGMLALVAAMLILGAGTSGATGETSNRAASVLQAQNWSQPQQPDAPLAPVTTTFTYQGYLAESGSPANGQYDFDFRLFDALTGGASIGPVNFRLNETVSGGVFTVPLDFGSLNGTAGWLEIKVRRVGGPSFILLTPRQRLTPAPYAMTLSPSAIINGTSSPGGQILVVSNNSTASNTFAIRGVSTGTSGAAGLLGIATGTSGNGVFGSSIGSGGNGVFGSSIGSGGNGVFGSSSGNNATGVYGSGTGDGGNGVVGETGGNSGGRGVTGRGSAAFSLGVFGTSSGANGRGVVGSGTGANSIGVLGISSSDDTSLAGRFQGDVQILGNISKGGGSFKIDHPLDPANKYLYHSFVESPDMMNIYNGNITTDAKGDAVMTLPEWFEALNKDFRYQLTPIGQFAQAIVAEEVKGNRFTIKTYKPNVKVSWQVTGIRKDAYAEAHRIPVVEAKEGDEKGKYLYPKEQGQPESKGIDYEITRQLREESEKAKP